jgi:hypothetical protein
LKDALEKIRNMNNDVDIVEGAKIKQSPNSVDNKPETPKATSTLSTSNNNLDVNITTSRRNSTTRSSGANTPITSQRSQRSSAKLKKSSSNLAKK